MASSVPRDEVNTVSVELMRQILRTGRISAKHEGSSVVLFTEALMALKMAGLLSYRDDGRLTLSSKGRSALRAVSADPEFPWMDWPSDQRLADATDMRFPEIGRDTIKRIAAHVSSRQGNLSGAASRGLAED